MIDYQKHRANLSNISPKKWKWIVAADYNLLIQTSGLESLMTKCEIKAACNLVNDGAELLDKAEKWDKAVVVSEDNKDHLDRRSPVWDIAATRSSALFKIGLGVVTSSIIGGIALLFFKG